jgi:hypothetical protein
MSVPGTALRLIWKGRVLRPVPEVAMQRPAIPDFLLILSVMVLAAATVDLLLPSPHCTLSRADAATVAGPTKAADGCIAVPAMVDSGQREP